MSDQPKALIEDDDAGFLAFRLEIMGIDEPERVAAALCRTAIRLGIPTVAKLGGEDMLAHPFDTTETVLDRYRENCGLRRWTGREYD